MTLVAPWYSLLTRSSLARAILRILAGMLAVSTSPLTIRKVLIAQSSSSWYSVQSLRDHLFSLRVSNASPAKLVTCVA
jgi:hypothetical protein